MSIEAKNVAVGSLADMTSLNWHVRFTPNSEQRWLRSACSLSANSGHGLLTYSMTSSTVP
jgi:hypothetical protein